MSKSTTLYLGLGLNNALLRKVLDNNRDGALDIDLVGLDVDLRLGGGLVRRRDTGELLDLAGTRLGVETLGVALLDDVEGRVDEHLDEGERGVVLGVQGAREVAVGSVGRDEGGEGERGGGGEEERDLADAADLELVELELRAERRELCSVGWWRGWEWVEELHGNS